MSIFQKSVLKKNIGKLSGVALETAFANFKSIFSNQKIETIKTLKEEEYQDGFLRDLFVGVLGYTLKPDNEFNLVREQKNVSDSKKADGAVVKDEKVIAVIELKSTATRDLNGVVHQAFGYKNNHEGCKYVITSNFQHINLYVDNSAEFESFDLFDLSFEEFAKLYLILNKESLFNDLPAKMKQESFFHEQHITKKLYSDYKAFKDRVYKNLVEGNPQFDKLTLFKKAQKLLDRILFILFAEDLGLIPPNTVKQIILDWETVCKKNRPEPLYNFFRDYFSYIDKGKKGDDFGEIPAYNGGLFSYDEILDSPELNLPDGLLQNNLPILSQYDFSSEVDVNILGHIFEHSLSEIEEVTAEIQGNTTEKVKSKRKKDGIFYTPKYITKYIVETTVGALCKQKKIELGIDNLFLDTDIYFTNNQPNANGFILIETLQKYKKWLLALKILDPACGSGAFLNQALDFLIAEHKYIDSLLESLTGQKNTDSDTDKSILESNIYGVDINEESVEIAKLSLWLRTAKRGRALSDLSGNIKCGNSLIDDKTIAGDSAFVWEEEFPQVFNSEVEVKVSQKLPEAKPDYVKLVLEKSKEAQMKAEQAARLSHEALEISKQVYAYAEKINTANEPESQYYQSKGGFDVVIGNPPYVRLETMKETSEALSKMQYRTFEKRGDLYVLFVERGFNLLKNNGIISFIMPNKWIQAGYGRPLRAFFLQNRLEQLIDFGDIQIFEGATTYPCIFVARKTNPTSEIAVSVLKNANSDDFEQNVQANSQAFGYESFSEETWVISSNSEQSILQKLKSKFRTLSEYVGGEANYGIKFGLTEAFLIDNKTAQKLINDDPNSSKLIGSILRGRDVKRYSTIDSVHIDNIILAYNGSHKILHKEYPAIYNHLIQYEDKLKKRGQCNGSPEAEEKQYTGQHHWLELDNNPSSSYLALYEKPKIMYQKFQVKPCFIFDDQGLYCNDSMWIIPTENKALLAILNSKMGWWLITKYCTQIQNGYQLIWKYFGQIPVANAGKELASKANQMLTLNKQLQVEKQNFLNTLKEDKGVSNITRSLENFSALEYDSFKKELLKQKVKFTLGNENNQWREYFDTTKQKVNGLQNQISQLDREIDHMVYELYELTPQEIEIVEKSVK